MSTLEQGRGQGIWGASLLVWGLYFAFAPVRLAFRVERKLRALPERLRRQLSDDFSAFRAAFCDEHDELKK